MSDASTLRKLKDGQQETFSKFFETYKNLIFYTTNNILKDRLDAEDITQEVFIEFFNNIKEVPDDANLKLYISSLAKKRAIDLYRKKAKTPMHFTDEIENYGEIDKQIHPTLTLDHLLEEKEAHIVSLRIIYDFSFKEIAIDMNMSLGTIQGIYYSAIKKLKKHYKKGN